jgi:light-harvesting complex 1 beta chain
VGRGRIRRAQLGVDLASLVLRNQKMEVFMAQVNQTDPTFISDSHLNGYRMIFVLMFCVFMALAVVGQLLALNWRTWLPGAEGSTTTLVGVKSAVYTVISQLS